MKADFSRDTFQRNRRYRRVLGQQGRVVVDADRNEQTAIDIGISERTTGDVIGPTGVPETSLSSGYNGGFEIGISADGSDLTISHGRIYVAGMLVENGADTTLLTQPFLPLLKGALAPAGIAGDGLYAVYLGVWERLITPIDDPSIVETALGGPDTALRSQIAWQVKFGAIDTVEFGDNPDCAAIAPPWANDAAGKLAAKGGAPSIDPVPCVLPPQAGYRGLENQLYRVEIHTGGGYGTATFKWSRENGSIIAGVVSAASGSFASPTFNVQTAGRDATLGFATGDWVELIDDASEFETGIGQLLQVGTVDPTAMTISVQTTSTLAIDPAKHPKLRRWDQSRDATPSGVAIAGGDWMDLENGVQVRFSNDTFAVGDYWLIPARASSSSANTGSIEWPIDPVTAEASFEPPLGIKRAYTKLAIVAYAGTAFSAPRGATAVTDCRLFFPPLTSVRNQSGPCTIVLRPGTNWSAPLVSFFNANPAADAEICFAVGEFPTSQTIAIATTGNVKVTGAGWGTQIVGTNVESVLRFSGCASASVCDLSAKAARGDTPVDVATKHINGTLEFDGCSDVRVSGVALSCGSGPERGAACLTVRSTVDDANAATGTGTTRVYDSSFTVGETQYGMLLVHQARAFIERNEIAVIPSGKRVAFSMLAKNAAFVKQFARTLIHGASISPSSSSLSSSSSSSSATGSARGAIAAGLVVDPSALLSQPGVAAAARAVPNASVTVGHTSISFSTPPQLKNLWQTYADLHAPKKFGSNVDLLNFVRTAAEKLVAEPKARAAFTEFADVIRQSENQHAAVAMRAITVGGRGITELRVRDNAIAGFMQGIVVGVSHKERKPAKLPADMAGFVTIGGNAIEIAISPIRGHRCARYGIFVGNVNRLQIENNELSYTAVTGNVVVASDGIRAYGYFGPKVIVRHNDVKRFSRGIVVTALAAPGIPITQERAYEVQTQKGTQWLVADNVFEGVRMPIEQRACTIVGNMTI